MKAIITGITGQDGSHLADFLLEKGYKVVGVRRRSSIDNTHRIKHILDHPNFTLESGDICLLYTSPSPRDVEESRMPSSA